MDASSSNSTKLSRVIWIATFHLTPPEFFGIAFWMGFTIHLIAAEAWILKTRRHPAVA